MTAHPHPTHSAQSADTTDTAARAVDRLQSDLAALLLERGPQLEWAVQLSLAEAYNYLDSAHPNGPSAMPAPTPVVTSSTAAATTGRLDPDESTTACIERLRGDALTLIEAGTVPHVYALGYAAGELAAALREIANPRPA